MPRGQDQEPPPPCKTQRGDLKKFVEDTVFDPDVCMVEWPFSRTRGGRPHLSIREKGGKVYVVRYAWFLLNGYWADEIGKQLNHHRWCEERPLCWNPYHVYPGTTAENWADALATGELPEKAPLLNGERNIGAVLTQAQVDEIRRRASMGESQVSIGRDFTVNQSTICRIVNKLRWAA